MPQMFNIVAQVQFQSNVNSAVARMKQQFSTLGKGTFISPTASRGVTELTGNLQKLQVRLDAVASSARQVNQAFSSIKDSAKSASAMNALASSSAKSAAAAARTAKNVQAATKEVDQFGRAVAIASKRFVAFQVAAPAIYAVQNAFSDAIKQAAQFDREMVRIQQVGSDSAATMGDLATEIGRLSKGLGVSSLGLAQVATTLRQAGLSAADVKTSLSALAKTELTPTFKNINNTVEGSIALMRQFGLGARDLESALGSVNTVSAQFAVESEDLVEVIRKAGSSFKSASSSFTAPRESLNQLLALFTSVRDTTRESADSIGTGFRTIFARLQSNEVAKGLRDLGVNLHYTANEAALLGQNVEGQFVGAFTAIRRLSEATKGLQTTDPRFSAIAEQIGGIRQISRVLPLLQQFETTQRALTAAQTGSNSLTRDATKANDAFLVKLSKVKEEFVDLVRTIGNDRGFRAFLDFSLKLASSLTAITRALTPLLPALATLGTIKLAGSIGKGFSSLSSRPARGYALGGYVGDDTGVVPGSGSGDIVPAKLAPGQFVIKKSSARKIGYGNLRRMARGYADGGRVDAMVEPQEFIFSQKDAQRIGYDKLNRINQTGEMKKSPRDKALRLAKKAGIRENIASRVDANVVGDLGSLSLDDILNTAGVIPGSKVHVKSGEHSISVLSKGHWGESERTLNRDKDGNITSVTNDFFEASNKKSGAGTTSYARQVLHGIAPSIEMEAAGSNSPLGYSGYKVWPIKFGVDGPVKARSRKKLLEAGKLPEHLATKRDLKVSDILAMPNGENIWSEFGGSFDGKIDPRSPKAIAKIRERLAMGFKAGKLPITQPVNLDDFMPTDAFASGGIVQTSHGRVKTSPYGRSYNLDQFEQQNIGQRVRLRRVEADPDTGEATPRARFYAEHRKNRFSKRIGFAKGGRSKKKRDLAAEWMASQGQSLEAVVDTPLNDEINANTGAGKVRRPRTSAFVKDLKAFGSSFGEGEIDIDAPRFAQQDIVANRVKAMQMMKAERDARVAAQTERIAGLVSEGKIPKYERDLSEKALASSLPAVPVRQKGRASSPRLAAGVKLPVPAKFSASTPAIPQTAVSSSNIDEIISKVQGLDPNFDPGNVPDAVRRLSKISPGMDPREAKLLMNNLLGVSSPAPLPASATTKRKRKPRTKKGAGAIIPPTPPAVATGSGDSPEERRNRGFTNGPNYQGELDFYDVPSMFGAYELHSDQNPLGNVNPFPTAAEVQEAKRQQQAQQRMLASEIQSMRMGRQGVYSQTMYGGSTRPSMKNSPFAVNDRPGRVLDAQRLKDAQRLAENPEVQAIRSMGASPAPQVGNLEALASSLGLFGAAGRNRGSAPWEPEGTTRRSREIDAIRGMGGYADLTQRQTNRRTQAAQAKRDAAQAKRDAEVADSQKRFEEIDALRSMNSKRNRTPNLGSTYGQRRAREARDATRQRQYQERIDAGNAAIDQAIAVNDIRSGVTRGPRREFSTTPELRNQLQARRREAGQYGWNDRATLDLHLDMKQANSEKKMLDLGMDQTGRKLSSKERAEGYKKFYAENPLLDPNSDFQKARKARTRSLNRGESQALNATRRGFRGDLSQFFQQSQGLNIEDAIARADKALERNERVEFNRAGSIKAVLPNRGLFGKVSETLGGVGRFDVGARLRNSRLGRSNLGRRAAIGARKLGRQVGGSGRFAALGLAAASTSLLLPQDDPNGPPDKANAARMGATTGATTGGAIGLQFGPLAGAIGALVGGVIGYTSALKDAEKQIAEFEFDKSFKEFEYSLSGLASGLRKIDQGGISAIIGGVGRAQTEASRRTKEEGVGGFFDRNLGRGSTFESVTQTAPKGFLNSLALSASAAGIPAPLATGGAKTLATIPDFISNKLGFGNVSENLFSNSEDLFKQEGAKRQTKLTDILSPQLPAFQQIGERIAQSIKLSEADFRGDPESRRTAILSQFDQKGGGKIADTIASVGEIPLNEVRQNFLKVAIESNQLRLQQEGLKKSVNLTTLQFQKFGRLEQALDSVTVSIEEMRSGLDTTATLFSGDLSASKTGNFSSRLGDQDPSRFGRNAAFLEANLGSGGGNLAGNFTQALKEVDTVLRDGSGVVTQAISKGGLDPELIGNQLRGAFASDSFGLSKDSQSKLGAAIDAIDPKELIDKARTNSQKLIEELVQQAFGDMPDQMQGLTKKITEQMDNFAQGLAQATQQVQQASEARGRVASLQLGSQRASAQSRAFSSGRFSQAGDFLSLDQLRQPFNSQQRLLAGNDAGDPDAIFNTFKRVQAQIEQADQRLKDPSLKPGERGATLESRSGLVLQASNLQKALEHLADTSEETASIQEKLNDVERQRQAGLSLTERLLTASPSDARQMRKSSILTDTAVGQGDFRGFNPKNIQKVLEYLRSVGDLKLPGYDNRTGNDLAESLLMNSGEQLRGKGLGGLGKGPILSPDLAFQTDQLLKEQENVAGRGEQAGGRVADIKDSLAAKFLDNLKSTNEQFLSKMDALLNAANIKDKQSALDRANVEQGVAKDRLIKSEGLALDFGVQGDGLEQARRLVNAPEFNNFRDARAARLNINQKSPIAQQKIAQSFSGQSGIADVFGTSVPFVNKIAKGTSEDQKRALLESHKNALFTAAPAIASNTGLTTGDVNNVALPKYLSRQQSAADRGQVFDTGKELNKAISEAVSAAKLNIGSREVDARKDVARAAYGTDSDEAKKKVDKAADNFLDISKKLSELDSIQSFAQAQREFTQALEAATKAANERSAAEGSAPVVRKAMGGSIFKPHGTDTVPAMLTPGEYVVNARAARSNKALLDEMNYSGGAKYFADGGSVEERLARRKVERAKERDDGIRNRTKVETENRARLQAKIAEYKQSRTYGRGITAPAAKGKLSKRNEKFLKYFESATDYNEGESKISPEEIQKAQRGYQQLLSLEGTFDPRVANLRKKFLSSNIGKHVSAAQSTEQGGGMGRGMGIFNLQPISLNRNNTVEGRIARARQRRATKADARARIVNRNQNAVRRRLHQPDKEMPAMLSPGEAVVNANAARKNRGTLDQINKPGVHPIYRASGGSTGGPSGGSSASGSLGKFDETLSKFTAIVNKMDSAMKGLAQVLANNPIPSQIYLKIEPTRHEVILNAGALLSTLTTDMKAMINQAIAVHFANYDKAQATRVN